MEKQLKAERERRAAILTAEGEKQAAILKAEGAKQSAVLTAEGEAFAAVIRADAEAKAVHTIYAALHDANPSAAALAHRYLETLPELAQGEANKVWILPSELTGAISTIKQAFVKE